MRIILARHGNTFAPEEKVVWAGAKQDLPLVERGIEQAREFGKLLALLDAAPAAVYSSPLKRTRRFAEMALEEAELAIAVRIDSRLNEIDYGAWGGLSNQEVAERFGEAEQELWNAHSTWPLSAGWGSSPQEMTEAVGGFCRELQNLFSEQDTVVVVSSNGCLRYFLTLIPGEFERRCQNGTFKVKPGNVCQINCISGIYGLQYWNQTPQEAAPCIGSL